MSEYDYLYKIILVGEAAVGKTHLLSRYVTGALPKRSVSTIGVEFATKTIPLQSGGTVKAQIWDTAGQERYRAITSAHYRRAVGALLVYDLTNERTYWSIKRWMQDIRDQAEPGIVIMLVGNKLDLVERTPALRKVTHQEAAAFAKENGLLFEEASAFTMVGIREVFEGLMQAVYTQQALSQHYTKESGTFLDPTKLSSTTCCSPT